MVDLNHHTMPFYGCIILSVLAVIFNVISYFSFNWIESFPELKNTFVRMGLWGACFDNYMHPEDYVSKLYEGCWFIYWKEYKFIRDWLTPAWFIAVQVLASISVICNAVVAIMYILKAADVIERNLRKTDGILIILQFVAFICISFDVTYVGVMSKDRNWLPRPDHNRVGWSFALHVIAGFCSLYATLLMLMRFAMDHCKQGIPWDVPIFHNSDLKRANGDDINLNGRDKEANETLMPQTESGRGGTMVSAADASQRHREYLARQQRSRLASAASSTYGGGPRPAASYGRLPGVPAPMSARTGSQPYLGPMTDSTV